jgi:hypothetical protein
MAVVAFEGCLIGLLKRAFPHDWRHGPFLIVSSNRIVLTLSLLVSLVVVPCYAILRVRTGRTRREHP